MWVVELCSYFMLLPMTKTGRFVMGWLPYGLFSDGWMVVYGRRPMNVGFIFGRCAPKIKPMDGS